MKTFLAGLAALFGGWLIINLVGAFIVGFIARAIFPAKDRVSWPMTLLIGFLGGIVGKILFAILRWPNSFIMGFVASIVGAFLLLLVHHMRIAGRKSSAT